MVSRHSSKIRHLSRSRKLRVDISKCKNKSKSQQQVD